MIDAECPAGCSCDGSVVDCSGRGLSEVPRDIPRFTTDLLLQDNELTKVRSDGLFGRLPNLVKLDLRRNKITGIEQNAFEGADKLSELLLSENSLREVHNKMFVGLRNLKSLSLYDNDITCIMPGSFEPLRNLKSL